MSDDRTTDEEPRPPAEPASDRVCGICGEPAVDVCDRCGSWYGVEHSGVEAPPDEPRTTGERPRLCWNCRLAGGAKAVLFWTVVAAVCLVALIYFFSLWV